MPFGVCAVTVTSISPLKRPWYGMIAIQPRPRSVDDDVDSMAKIVGRLVADEADPVVVESVRFYETEGGEALLVQERLASGVSR